MDQPHREFGQPQTQVNAGHSGLVNEEALDLKPLLHDLWGNRWLLAITTVVCFIFAEVYLHLKIPMYSANVLLQVDNKGSSQSLFADVGFGAASASSADVQTVLIKSRYILEPVAQTLGMDVQVSNDYFPLLGAWYARQHTDSLAKPLFGLNKYAWGGEQLNIKKFTVPTSQENKNFNLIADETPGDYRLFDDNNTLILKGHVNQLVTKSTSDGLFVFQVEALTANPGTQFHVFKKNLEPLAESIGHQIQINDLNTSAAASGATGVLEMSLIGSNPHAIVQLLNTIAQVAADKSLEQKTAEASKSLAFLNQQLPLVKQSINDAENELNLYRAKAGQIDLSLQTKFLLTQMTDAQKNLEVTKLAKVEALQKDTPEHPLVIDLSNKEKALTDSLSVLQAKLSQLPASDQTVVGLMRDVKVKSELYLVLLNKIQNLKVIKASTVSDLRILNLASVPDVPIYVNKSSILLGIPGGGFLFCALVIFIFNRFQGKIMDPNELEQRFGLINMAIVPFSKNQKEGMNKKGNNLLAIRDPKDLSIEALRSFRTSLQFSMIGVKNNIITIMGTTDSIGKSFISANFAYLLADTGKRVLLIDGDIRRGQLKNYFKIKEAKGLSDVLAGLSTFEEVVIKRYPQLDFIASGTYPPNPSELLMAPMLKHLLDRASAVYDLVIVDTAPVLAVTDAAVIGQHAGSNFIVLASNRHNPDEVQHALKTLKTNGIHVNGSIFNFADQQKGLYRYQQNYNYNYDYKPQYDRCIGLRVRSR